MLYTFTSNITEEQGMQPTSKSLQYYIANTGCLPNRCSQGWMANNTYSVLQSLQRCHPSQDAALTSAPKTSLKMLQATSGISYITSETLANRVQTGIQNTTTFSILSVGQLVKTNVHWDLITVSCLLPSLVKV